MTKKLFKSISDAHFQKLIDEHNWDYLLSDSSMEWDKGRTERKALEHYANQRPELMEIFLKEKAKRLNRQEVIVSQIKPKRAEVA